MFAVVSYAGHEPTFEIVTLEGHVFSYIPARGLSLHASASDGTLVPGDELVYLNAPSERAVVTRHTSLAGGVQAYFRKAGRWAPGEYLWTIDWPDDNALLHAIALDSGQIALLPSHKLRFEAALEAPGDPVLPPYRKLHATWRVVDDPLPER